MEHQSSAKLNQESDMDIEEGVVATDGKDLLYDPKVPLASSPTFKGYDIWQFKAQYVELLIDVRLG